MKIEAPFFHVDQKVSDIAGNDLAKNHIELGKLLPKHEELSAKSPRFRSLSMGKGVRPDPQFKELPAAPFGL